MFVLWRFNEYDIENPIKNTNLFVVVNFYHYEI